MKEKILMFVNIHCEYIILILAAMMLLSMYFILFNNENKNYDNEFNEINTKINTLIQYNKNNYTQLSQTNESIKKYEESLKRQIEFMKQNLIYEIEKKIYELKNFQDTRFIAKNEIDKIIVDFINENVMNYENSQQKQNQLIEYKEEGQEEKASKNKKSTYGNLKPKFI